MCSTSTVQKNYKRTDLLSPNVLLVGNDLSTGSLEELIKQTPAACAKVNSVDNIHVKVDVWDDAQVWNEELPRYRYFSIVSGA